MEVYVFISFSRVVPFSIKIFQQMTLDFCLHGILRTSHCIGINKKLLIYPKTTKKRGVN